MLLILMTSYKYNDIFAKTWPKENHLLFFGGRGAVKCVEINFFCGGCEICRIYLFWGVVRIGSDLS